LGSNRHSDQSHSCKIKAVAVGDEFTVILKDETPPSPLIVNELGDNDQFVTGTAEAFSKISLKAGEVEFDWQ
jgi:hypothetical protein